MTIELVQTDGIFALDGGEDYELLFTASPSAPVLR